MKQNTRFLLGNKLQFNATSRGSLVHLRYMMYVATVVMAVLVLISFPLTADTQEVYNLYPGTIPGAKTNSKSETKSAGMFRNVTQPTLEMYLPEKELASGAAVIICPGGSYSVLVYDGEGISMAKALQQKGVAAFVLKYRLPDDSLMVDKSLGPLQDAQQALKVVRENAVRWGVDPGKLGIIGFSAGGHLAATVATQFHRSLVENTANTSLRPDFQILVYPVISMKDGLTHPDSRKNLLGANSSGDVQNAFSNELQVTAQSPPAYITHASDDKLVDVRNSILYYEALQQKGIAVEMHLYQKGGHGFIFRQKEWVDPLFQWMKNNNWMKK